MAVSGFDIAAKAIADMGAKPAKALGRKALRGGGKLVAAAIKSESPERSGKTKRSIKVRAGRRSKGLISIIIGTSKRWFTGDVFYAAFVAFGHRIGSRKLGSSRKEVPANNFVERGWEKSKQSAVDKTLEILKEVAEK